jgi:hypothetical protein
MDQMIAYTDFRGGWNADAAPDSLADNELMQADNIDLDELGPFKKCKGVTPLNVTPYLSQVEQIQEWPRKDGTHQLWGVVGNQLAKIADDGTKTDLVTVNLSKIGYFYFSDNLYFVDGVNYKVYDGTTVSNVTANAATDNDLAPVKRSKFALWHPNSTRYFFAGDPQDPSALYYTEPLDPTYRKNVAKRYPNTAEGAIQGLAIFGDALLVFFQNSIWAWRGVDPASDVTWTKLPAAQGTSTNWGISLTPNTITFPGNGGIYRMSMGAIDSNVVMLTGNEMVHNMAHGKVSSVMRSAVHQNTMCALFDKANERYLLAYGDDPTNPRNNRILVLDWNLQAFTRYTEWSVNEFCQRSDGTILIATNNHILKMNSGNNSYDVVNRQSTPIPMAVKTKQFSLGSLFNIKKTKKMFLAAKQYDVEVSTVDVTITDNYKTIEYDGISLDDSFTWGETWGNTWGYSDYTNKQMKVKLKGQRIQAIFKNTQLDQPVTIYGLSFAYQIKRAKGVKV